MFKNVKIRILAFFMALTLSFCVCSNEYYQVNALEWVAPVVGLDTALKAILGLLGISASVGLASQIDWSDLQDDCVQYQIQKGNDAVAVGRWWDKVISGGLDTASECWSSFKEWAKNDLLSSSSSGGTVTSNDALTILKTKFPNLVSVSPSTLNDATITMGYYGLSTNGDVYIVCLYDDKYSYNIQNGTYQGITYNKPVFVNSGGGTCFYTNNTTFDATSLRFNWQNTATQAGAFNSFQFYFFGITADSISNVTNFHLWEGISLDNPGVESDFDSAVSDLGVIGLAPDVATDLPYDGVIDIPWENVGGTDTAIDDAFDDALDKVNTGTWTLDQYWTWVQNVTNVFAYDTTNNYLLPNDGDDEKADDKVQQNINRGAMVLYGLEKVFPFCIPWDIYAFVNLLVADPVAPVIEYPIYNPVSGEDEVITIDFSVWESQVILMRYIQDFLLIIGLLLLARSLIGAGGSD